MSELEFYNKLEDLKIFLTDEQKNMFKIYANELQNYCDNITAIKENDEIYLKHFYDSLTLVKIINLKNEEIELLDIGSGGGFPGIVLKIVFPKLKITLLDSNSKKTRFQNYMIDKLSLSGIVAINERAENFFKTGKKFDVVVGRAVAALNILTELCLPFVKLNGYFIAMKGNLNPEYEEAKYAIEFLGGKVKEISQFNLRLNSDARSLIKIEKLKETPDNYPRVYDKILKKPLKISRK